jgi:isopentenyl-diphosphate delta-isomerase
VIPAIAENGSLYPIEKLEAHRVGALHLAISVFVFCEGQLLIQRRALGKYHSPGLWANTCCSHPHWGEAPETAATRRLQEELGLVCDLSFAGVTEYRADVGSGLIEHERVHAYVADLPFLPKLSLNPEEVMEVDWISVADLKQAIAREPGKFAEWLKQYLAGLSAPPLDLAPALAKAG